MRWGKNESSYDFCFFVRFEYIDIIIMFYKVETTSQVNVLWIYELFACIYEILCVR